MKELLRIANAGGYWGDDPEALRRQVEGGRVDYVTMDFLAEITMVILERQRAKNPQAGYARDFLPQLKAALPFIVEKGIKVIVNAGGVNPEACRAALVDLFRHAGVSLPIGVVSGDDILPCLPELRSRGVPLSHMDSGRPYEEIAGRVASARVYLGARPIVEALRGGAQIVVTGRTTDGSLVLAPMIYEFGWEWNDWRRLAAGTVAGHIIECGSQVTGGNLTDWQELPSMLDMGYPVVEVSPSGDFAVTKHPGTGGAVTVKTVTEQLLYEIGDPSAYLTPDVSADFTTVRLIQEGPDRVRVWGVQGDPAPSTLKVSAIYTEGYKAAGHVLLSGPQVLAKAQKLAEIIWHRIGTDFADRRTDFIGHSACWGEAAGGGEPNEIIFRLAVRDGDRQKVERFSHLLLALLLQGPPGAGVVGGRPEVQEALAFWPTLIPREEVVARVEVMHGEKMSARAVSMSIPEMSPGRPREPERPAVPAYHPSGMVRPVPLVRLAYARSGDKGDLCNIGVAARSPQAYAFLHLELTAERVREYYRDLCRGEVIRYELPNLLAYNFMLKQALGGGGTLSLRVDHQGKTLAQGLLRMELNVDEGVLRSVESQS